MLRNVSYQKCLSSVISIVGFGNWHRRLFLRLGSWWKYKKSSRRTTPLWMNRNRACQCGGSHTFSGSGLSTRLSAAGQELARSLVKSFNTWIRQDLLTVGDVRRGGWRPIEESNAELCLSPEPRDAVARQLRESCEGEAFWCSLERYKSYKFQRYSRM